MAADNVQILNVNHLPDNIILHILDYLDVKHLCISGQVCCRWRRIVKDNKLWRHVDLRPYRLNLPKIWKVLRAHFSDILLSLHIKGYLDPNIPNWMKHNLSNAMLRELKERCPNLQEFTLIKSNLSNVSSEFLPEKLNKLSIEACFLPPKWFSNLNKGMNTSLAALDLNNSSKLSNSDMQDLKELVNLEVLILNGCYRLTEEGLCVINEFTKLVVLEISDTGCTDLNLHLISRKNILLKRVNLCKCKSISDGGVTTLPSGLKQLKYLDITKCQKITPAAVKQMKDVVDNIVSD